MNAKNKQKNQILSQQINKKNRNNTKTKNKLNFRTVQIIKYWPWPMSKQSTRSTRSASSPLGGRCCQRVRFRVTSPARFGPFAVGAPLLAHLSFRCTLKSTRIHHGESLRDPLTPPNSSRAFRPSIPPHVDDVDSSAFFKSAFSRSHVPRAPHPREP